MIREGVQHSDTIPEEMEDIISIATSGKKIHIQFPSPAYHVCTFEIKDDGLAYIPATSEKTAPTGREIKKARKIAVKHYSAKTK